MADTETNNSLSYSKNGNLNMYTVGTAQKMQVHTTSFIEKASASTFISSSSSSSGFAGK